MVISQNVPALSAQLNMMRANRALADATKRLSSGYKINSAKDDPAGMAISTKLSLQLAGLTKATDNASNGVALVSTAEGALNEVHNMLQRMRELAVQAATDTLEAGDRDNILQEVKQLTNEIQGIANRTEYNGIKILNGEGSRITEGHEAGITTADNNISTILYVSEDVPAGRLEYTIDKAGEPAVMALNAPVGVADPIAVGGGIKINGITVEIIAGDSRASALEAINEAMSYAGITNMPGGANGYLVSEIAGSKQEISIEGDSAVLSQFGFAAGRTIGKDAVISDLELYDDSGSATPIASGNSLVAAAEGNQVTVTGMNGEVVYFNIQAIMTDPSATPPTQTDGGGTNHTPGKEMEFEFKDYGPIKIQVGGSYNNNVSVQIPKLSAETLGLIEYKGGKQYSLLNYCTRESAELAIGQTDDAIDKVSSVRSRLGAYINRFESTVRALDVANENTESSRSRIQDTDMAKEMTKYAQMNVMYQAGISILTQANQRPSQVLQMLQ